MKDRFQVNQEIAPGFTVVKVTTKRVPATTPHPIASLTEVQLNCLYENVAFLAYAAFKETLPPSDQWIKYGLGGHENIRQVWKPHKIKQESVCLDYHRRAQAGHLMAVSHAIAVKKNVLVSAQLQWFGFPFVNRFFVGFKPGMRERTEELLLAGLKLA